MGGRAACCLITLSLQVFSMVRCPCCLGTEKTEDRDQTHLVHLARCDGALALLVSRDHEDSPLVKQLKYAYLLKLRRVHTGRGSDAEATPKRGVSAAPILWLPSTPMLNLCAGHTGH
ncbi:unnamed protein product [Pleuronectes platessa]|uniref:Secreted protein n=1 Tax=Pleuronectes platessa TaxID=8262 RepID=A0A9N7UCP8_PLEPL|nr:unnamed protein product [Pleuronectes platessa]